MMKTLMLVAVLAVLLNSAAFCAGGLECMNEPPLPTCTTTTPWTPCSPGFGEQASLAVSLDTSNGDVRVSFDAAGVFPGGKPFVFYHNSRDNRAFPAGVGRNYDYNVLLYEHIDEWHLTPVRIVLSNGYRVSFDENLDGTYRGEPGVFSRLSKLPDGSFRLYSDGSPDLVDDGQVIYEFSRADETGRARLRSITDGANSVTISYVLTGYGQNEISRIREQSTGREVVFTYDTLNRIKTITSLDNVVTTLDYNPNGDLITAQSNWGMLTFGYDSDHNITSITDGLGGHVAYIKYGSSARGREFQSASGETTSYSYIVDGSGNVTSATFGLGGQSPTVHTFNSLRLISSTTTPETGKVCYTYSADKCLTGQTYGSVQQAVKVAEATSSQVRAGS